MTEPIKPLTGGERHFMHLMQRDAAADGWTKVSKVLLPMVQKMPNALVEVVATDDGGKARLTAKGNDIMEAMQWLK